MTVFFLASKIPQVRFDVIVMVEVLEHLFSPIKTINMLVKHLSKDGIIAGTTDFFEGGEISDHLYIKPYLHIAYWSQKSLRMVAKSINRNLSLFKMEEKMENKV